MRIKIFAVIAILNVALALALFFFFKSSIESGVLTFIQQTEIRQSRPLASALELYYQRHAGWEALRLPPAWENTVRRHSGRPDSGPPPTGNPPAPAYIQPTFLLDANRQPVAGQQWVDDNATLLPLYLEDEVVGYLGIPPRPEVRDYLAQDFTGNQVRQLALATLLALGIALIAAVPLSHLLVQRIRNLVRQVDDLHAGDYSTTVELSGHDELNQLANHLTALGHTLKHSEDARQQWMADISHELRTPLAVLQADLEAIEDGVRPMDTAAVSRLQRQVERLRNLVQDLYELTLSDIGALTFQKSKVDLRQLVDELVTIMSSQFERAELGFDCQVVTDGPVVVLGDRSRLAQVLLNLLHNSLKYTTSPGQVVLRLEGTDTGVELTLEDTAPTVPELLQPKLFDRLFRVEESRGRGQGGAGLGLSLCQNMVRAHGGTIGTSTSTLGGLCVILRLPRQAVELTAKAMDSL